MPWPRTRWQFPDSDPLAARKLASVLDLPLALATALVTRGFTDPDRVRDHLAPSLRNLVPPDRFPGIPEAAARIRTAVSAGGTVLVFGDFDADGVCAAAVLASAIEAVGGRASVFIPDRITEGYGLSPAAVARALDTTPDARLLVTVDCGINQHEGCALCRTRGVEVIITDHHTLPDTLPDTRIIVNPHLPGTPPALAALAGVGVAFKLAHMLARDGERHCFDPATLLPSVAVGTVTDVASLSGENRILVHAGLARLNAGRHTGLSALQKASGLAGEATATDLAFRLGPRINAAGRIGNPMLAVELLRTSDPRRATELAHQLDALNSDRQHLEREASDAAFRILSEGFDAQRDHAAIVCGEDWHPGVIGLVAGRVCQKFRRPAIAFHVEEHGVARGSARCPDAEGLDLMALLERCKEHLLHFGGHRVAAGITTRRENLPAFADAFRSVCAIALSGKDLRPSLEVDAWLDPAELTVALHTAIQRLEPCGEGNPPVRLALRAARLAEVPKRMGTDGKHARLTLQGADGSGHSAVFFNAADDLDAFHPGELLDVAFTTRVNTYWGAPELQLLVEDLRPTES